MENGINRRFQKGSPFLTSLFMKSYWDFSFHSFNYRSEHLEMCFIKEPRNLFPAALVKDCLLPEGSRFPA